MNWLDAALVIFLILMALAGLMRGFIKTLLPLVGLMVGVVVAGKYYTGLAHDIFSSHSTAAYVAAFLVIVLVFLIAAMILAMVLHELLKLVLLGWLDHLAGLVLGAVLGYIIAGAILTILLKHSVGVSTISDSEVANYMVNKFPVALAFLPGDYDRVKDFFH